MPAYGTQGSRFDRTLNKITLCKPRLMLTMLTTYRYRVQTDNGLITANRCNNDERYKLNKTFWQVIEQTTNPCSLKENSRSYNRSTIYMSSLFEGAVSATPPPDRLNHLKGN